jgi:inner membrane protein
LGITLLLCAPLANVLVTSGHRVEVPRWVGIALVVTMVPDFDIYLPWITHRGVTHSLLAAVCLGVVVAVVAAVKWSDPFEPPASQIRRAMLGFAVGAGSIVSHLIGDVITPMGIRPFFPLDSVYTLNLVYAKDLGANIAFVVIGLVVFVTVYRHSNDPLPADGVAVSDLSAESDVHSVNS